MWSSAREMLTVLALGLQLLTAPAPAGAQGTYAHARVATALNSPVAMAVAPDGRVFIALQGGDLMVVENDTLLAPPFVSVSTIANDEEGLVGVALDPNFGANHFVYVTYTVGAPTRHNRIVRYTANGNVAVPGSAVTIFDLDENVANYHLGGALRFALDGKLLTTTGDNANDANSQNLTTTHGKILRLNSDGSIPGDNPAFGGQTTGKYRAIWGIGFRNAFSFAVQPGTGRIFVNDVGGSVYEEIDDGIAGSNYGWPTVEGPAPPDIAGIRYPLHTYDHSGGACAVTGGTFYNPTSPRLPATAVGHYFYGEYCLGQIRAIDPANPAVVIATESFDTVTPGPVDLAVAPDGSLYYLARGNPDLDGGSGGIFQRGELVRVTYDASGMPSISTPPASQSVPVGDTATFTVVASGADPLDYQWTRNGIDIGGATADTYTTPATTLGDDGAAYRCRVHNGAGTVTSAAATLTVVNGTRPTVAMTAPEVGAHYDAGDVLAFAATATDAQDGALAGGAFTWRIDFRHNTHAHPALPATAGITSGSYAIPTIGETATNVFFRVTLQVQNSLGLVTTVTRDVLPNLGTITLDTDPSGLEVELDGQEFTGPYVAGGVIGLTRQIGVDATTTIGGQPHAFASFSDGGGNPHPIAFPATPVTYRARYLPQRGLVLTRLACQFRFDAGRKDKCNVRGTLRDVPAGFAANGQTLTVDVGGARLGYTLDGRGRGTGPNGAVALLVPSGFGGGELKFRAKFFKGTWSTLLGDEGVNPSATVKNQPLTVRVSVPLADAAVHTATGAVTYKGTANKRGRFKLQ